MEQATSKRPRAFWERFLPDNLSQCELWDLPIGIIGDGILSSRHRARLCRRFEDLGNERQAIPSQNRQRLSARAAIHVLAGDAASAHDEIESARGPGRDEIARKTG